jgi:hypothetical protein
VSERWDQYRPGTEALAECLGMAQYALRHAAHLAKKAAPEMVPELKRMSTRSFRLQKSLWSENFAADIAGRETDQP